ncbi:MAG: hypothetical protein FH747_03060 [Stenotrophomonas sp.]|uniref:hypothetical protein n=1 Tax=Stenotrophomonas sp. TaxID=69392 RepID=UPI0013548CD7|nr:hypothetical protein [Stenotrophomonas sp.]MTI72567.1 hypothetical protein [Stenotrophomonas sp.]MTI72627.1 hypothetical protein [Stenotrophomonas sp.]
MNVRESSLIAYDTLKTADLGRQEKQVLAGVALLIRTGQHTDGWVSRRQIAQLTGLETSTVAARTNSLIAAHRLVESEELTPCPVTGRNVHKVGLPASGGRAAA